MRKVRIKATQDKDPEVAHRAQRILAAMDIRLKWPPTLLQAIPGIEERLASDGHAWTELFLKVSRDRSTHLGTVGGRDLYVPAIDQKRDDLELLALPALRGTRDAEERASVCRQVGLWKCKSALLEIAELLKSDQPQVRASAAGALACLEAREKIPDLVALLKDKDSVVRSNAGAALDRLMGAEAIPHIIKLLKDDASHVRWYAAGIIGQRRAKEAKLDVRHLLKDPDWWTRKTAAEVLLDLNDTEAAPHIRNLLKDPTAQVREAAVRALGEFDEKSVAPEIIPLLDDASVRVVALHALRRMNAEEARPKVSELLESGDDQVRAVAARTSGELRDGSVAGKLSELLEDKNRSVRFWAASSLCRMGNASRGAAFLCVYEEFKSGNYFSAPGALFPLNAIRQPELWKRLSESRLVVEEEATTQEVLEALSKQGSFRIDDLSALVVEQHQSWRSALERPLRKADRKSLLRTVDYLLEFQSSPYEVILESDHIRILGREEAFQFWQDWAAEQKKR